MKRSILAALAAAVLLAGAASVRADDGKKRKDGDDTHRAEWAAKMQERMKERLDLSDEQSAKLAAAFKAAREEGKPLREKARAAAKKLASVVAAGTDAEVEAALKESHAARKALHEQRQKMHETLAGILKPRQLAKLEVDRARMMHRGFRMGRHGRHHDRDGERGWGGRDDHEGRDGDKGAWDKKVDDDKAWGHGGADRGGHEEEVNDDADGE